MGFTFALDAFPRYAERVGPATVVDVSRRTDPARIGLVFQNLGALVERFGPPWVVQLWTKDLSGTLAQGFALLAALRRAGTTLVAELTVTGLGGTLFEPRNLAAPFAGVEAFSALAGGPEHIQWRYDPIIPGIHRLERFRTLAGLARSLGIRRAVINFLVPPGGYKRADRRLAGSLAGWAEGMPGYDEPFRLDAARELLGAAREHGLRLAICAESAGLCASLDGLARAACGDHQWFESLSRPTARPRGRGSRPGCGCGPYFDVGVYGQWRRCHGCLYCYAG